LTAGPLTAGIRFELGFGWTMVKPSLSASYVNQYAPPLTTLPPMPPPEDRYIGSSASHTVHFNGKTAFGLNGFFNLLLTENFGIQVLADYHRPGIGGANDPCEVVMQFLAFEPETYEQSIEWPASKGNLTQTTFSLNALARFRVASDLSLSISGGPSVFHIEGEAGYIGYTFGTLSYVEAGPDSYYELGGGTYQMIAGFGPATKYGYNVGIEAAYEAFRHVILAFDIRWYGATKSDLQMRLLEDDIIEQPIDEIADTIGLGSLEVDPSYFRAGLAIRFIF
jgi:hypothetical protein